MKTAGIIAEYNPMHNGHIYHINKTRETFGATHVVAVLSSNCIQRGEFSMFSKWTRAGFAVKNGVDLVIELPSFWSCSFAQRYASGGVSLLNSLGCVDILSFGSECGDIDLLKRCSSLQNDKALSETIKAQLSEGLTFASARTKAIESVYGNNISDVFKHPNNNLAIEYINALEKYESTITPMTVKRLGTYYGNSSDQNLFAGASYIRELIQSNKDISSLVPVNIISDITKEISTGKAPCSLELLESAVLCALRQMSSYDISLMPEISEGIEYRIYEAAQNACSLDELYSLSKTKRYTMARIKRIVLYSFIGMNNNRYSGNPPYIKVLAMNGHGKDLLKRITEKTELPVIIKASDSEKLKGYSKEIYELEAFISNVYSLSSPVKQKCGREKTEKISVVN